MFLGGEEGAFRRRTVLPSQRVLCFWVGARLAYAVGRDGVPVTSGERAMIRALRPEAVVGVFGEIDVRTRLARPGALEPEWVGRYVRAVEALGRRLRVRSILILEPPAPSDSGADNPDFPRAGTLEARIEAHHRFVDLLEASVTSARVVRTADLVADSSGRLRDAVTLDGVHLTPAAAAEVRARLASAAETSRRPTYGGRTRPMNAAV